MPNLEGIAFKVIITKNPEYDLAFKTILLGASASQMAYNNSSSGLEATSVQSALDELASDLDGKADASSVYTKTETNSLLDQKANEEDVAELQELTLTEETSWEDVSLVTQGGYYYWANGAYNVDDTRLTSKFAVNVGDKYSLTTFIRPATISGIIFFDSSDAVLSHDLDGTGSPNTYTDYEFVVPSGASSMAVQSANSSTLSLKKQKKENVFIGYSKEEINSKMEAIANSKYGVKWNLSNPDDLGTRIFDAEGMNASIGIGSTNGSSDFDSVFPWSEIKRCNIKPNANGAPVVTFEGENGFALDGSNGDVFVYIPKFAYDRYIENGYEFRVISKLGKPHPAFVEDGKELDEIFISAFEGCFDSNNKLRSIGGVIPSSNETPQTFLDHAQANGNNYSLYDSRCVDLIFTLFAVEYGCRNTNHVLGYGLADFEQPATYSAKNKIITGASNTNTVRTAKWTSGQKLYMPIGSNITVCDTTQQNILTQAKITACVDGADYTEWTFDGNPITVTTNCFIGSGAFYTNWCEDAPSGALSWHTGRTNWISNSITRNAIRYRWIENIFGNLWHYLPDVTFDALQMYVCKSMKDYVMHKKTSPYMPQGSLFLENNDNGDKADSTGSNYWITTLDNNIFTKGIPFGRTYDKSLTSAKAFGGYYYLKNTLVSIANGGGFDHLYRCNIMTQRAWIATTQRWYLYGARLMYKAID